MHNSNTFERLSVSALPDREVYKRDHPPAHYSLKITSFSLLEQTHVEKYDSGIFEAEGFKWKLSLYPNGDKKMGGAGHLSLYLAIEETDDHTTGWEVNAIIKFFVFDQKRNSYLTIQDANGAVRRFHEQKTEWGFSKLMMLDTFKQAYRGYLVDDTCVFGAEVFVVAPSGNWESLVMVKPKPYEMIHTWTIGNFSTYHNDTSISHSFTLGNNIWNMKVYPKGHNEHYGKYLSFYLALVGTDQFPPNRKIYASYKLRLVDQLHNHHHEKPLSGCWFDSQWPSYGHPDFIELKDLHIPAKGFIDRKKDIVIVEVEIHIMSEVKMIS